MRFRLYTAALTAALALLAPAAASAGDFHDMWLGQWKAHTAPFDGWEKVTRTVANDLKGDDANYAGWFIGAETCTTSSEDGVTYTDWACDRSGEVVVNGDQSRVQLYATLLHELGHARDWAVMGDTDRARFANTMGYNPNPDAWWDYLRVDGYRSPGELFAEANEFCGLSGKQRRQVGYFWGSGGRLDGGVYRWRPTHEQARQVCASLRRPA